MSGEAFDLVIRGGVCVTPVGTVAADIGVCGERIAAIGDLGRTKAEIGRAHV